MPIDQKSFKIAMDAWALIEDEGEANKGYAAFLAKYGNELTKDTTDAIIEIMSEESKHVEMLMKIVEGLTHIKPEGRQE